MGYVQYPAIKPPNITIRSPLHKVCTDTTCNFKPKMDIKNATYKSQMNIKVCTDTTCNFKPKTDIKNATYKSQTNIKTDIKGTTHNTKPQTNIKSKQVQEKEPSAATQEKQSRQMNLYYPK